VSAAGTPGGRRALTAVLLEDDPLDAELILRELETSGLHVEARRVDTRDAFACAVEEEPPPDVFLIDYQIPGFSGPEALVLLRARRPEAPAIIISGKVGEETAIEMLKSGATDYVLKQRLCRLSPAISRALREQALVQRRRDDEAKLGELTAEIERNGLMVSVFAQLHSAAIVADVPSGRVLLANARAEEMLGPVIRSVSGLADYGGLVLFRPDGRRYAGDEIPLARAVRRAEVICDEPALFLRADGDRGHALVSAARIHDRRGEVRAAVCVLTEDTEPRRLQAALERERAQLDAVLEAMPVGLALVDADLRYLRINRMMAAWHGLSAEAHIGRAVYEVLSSAMCADVEQAMRRVLATGEPVVNVELSGPAESGVHWLGTFFPVPAQAGTAAVGTVAVDITDRRRMEDALRRTIDFRDRFVGIVSHDLRNPLQVILASAEALLRSAALPDPLRPPLERTARSARQMTRIISDLLDVTRAHLGGGIPIAPRHVDLCDLCARTLADLHVAHAGRAVEMRAAGGIDAYVDPDRFAQILSNLVVNAFKYGKKDAPVSVHLRAAGAWVELSVCNEGPPIPEDLEPILFNAFTRGAGSGERSGGGVGLGLFIVHEIVRSHGGHVEVHRSGEGVTCFVVSLPKSAPDQAQRKVA
jgi:PAS domain S-box-containing protein